MRIKFLALIAGFLFISIAISSCLDSEDNAVELSSDATVHAFGLDTIYGKHYQFTIDQLNRVIYNQDSLPVGADTIIDRILIDTFSVSGWITAGINDTLFNKADSVNLTSAVNNEGMKFKVYAPDGSTHREYTLKINRHKLDPDSMQWVKMPTALPGNVSGQQTAVLLNEGTTQSICVYTANNAYKGALNGSGPVTWEPIERGDLPTTALTSLVNFKETLYATTGDGKVYQSTNGENWTESTNLNNSGSVQLLLAALPGNDRNISGIAGVVNNKFSITDANATSWTVSNNEVPTTAANGSPAFPFLNNISSTVYLSATNVQTAMIMGNNRTDETASIAWTTISGTDWVALPKNSNDTYCPKLDNPSIIHYNNALYAFGGPFNAFYKSIAGIAWYQADSKFWMPAEFKDRQSYSMVVDKDHYIWIMWANEVWRGRLNKLGFAR